MIGRKALSALLVAVGIMSVLAFGAGSAKAAVKELPLKDGRIEIVSKLRYSTVLEGKQPDSSNTKVEKVTEKAPDLATGRFSVMDGTAVKNEATMVTERTNKVGLSLADKFSNVGSGCYEYKISERFTDGDGKPLKDSYCGYQASKAVYRLRVYVTTDAKTGRHKLYAVTAESQGGVKVDKLEFVSLCNKVTSVNIDSKGKGDFADGNKRFEYVIKLEKAPVVLDSENKGGSFGVRVSVDDKDVGVKFGEGFVVSSKLEGGRIAVFAPVGTKYCIYLKEHKDGYTPGCRDGVQRGAFRMGEDKEYNFTISNTSNDVSLMTVLSPRIVMFDVVHVYNDNDVPVTGLSLDDRTGLMMVVISLGSIAALGAVTVGIKKKFTDR